MEQSEQQPEEGRRRRGARESARSTPADATARNPIGQAAADKVAGEGGGRLAQKKAAREAMRAAGVPVTKVGREAAAAQAAHLKNVADKAKAAK